MGIWDGDLRNGDEVGLLAGELMEMEEDFRRGGLTGVAGEGELGGMDWEFRRVC